MVLGIDVGSSTTKIAGLNHDAQVVGMLQAEAGDRITSAYGAFGKFVAEHRLKMSDIRQIVVTGVGAAHVEAGMYDIPTKRVDEFLANGLGGLRLAKLQEAFIVSVGTGTALVKATPDGITHIGGSGIGGGMLRGLAGRFAGLHHYNGIEETAARGDLAKVDLRLCDISNEVIGNLPPGTTVSNFGNIKDNATGSDIVLGLINLIFESVGMMAIFASGNDKIKDIVLIGALSAMTYASSVFKILSNIHPVKFHIPKDAVYATAVGAALSEFR